MWETQTLSASHARDNWTFHLYNEVNKLFSNWCFTMQVWISQQNSSFIKNTRHCQHCWSQQSSGSESHMNLVNGLAYQKIVHCSVVTAPTSIGVMGSNPIGDSKFFFFFFFLPFFFIFLFFVFARDKWTIHPHGVRLVMPVTYPSVYTWRESSSSCCINWPMDLDESEIMQYSKSDMLTLVLTPPVGDGFVWPSGTEKRMHGLSRPVYRLKMNRKTPTITKNYTYNYTR